MSDIQGLNIQIQDSDGQNLFPRIRTSNVINDGGFIAVSDSGSQGAVLVNTSQGPKWSARLGIASLPIGTIFYYPSKRPPEGAFLLNGQIIYNCSTLYPQFWQWLNTQHSDSMLRVLESDSYAAQLSQTGVCGAFVIDTASGSVRLPSVVNGFIEGSDIIEIGSSLQAGLPNITGVIKEAGYGRGAGFNTSGAFYGSNIQKASATAWGDYETNHDAYFDASRSSAIYGKSNTVQPTAVKYSACIQVFNVSTKLSQQESAQLASQMQSKVGVNADNFAAVGRDKIITDTFMLDNQISVAAVNTWYQAERDGILMATYANESTSPINCYLKYSWNMGVTVLATGLHMNRGHASFNLFVPKGAYYQVVTEASSDITMLRMSFLPLKNSISSNNS